jgi:hypothetical protein
VGRPMHKAESVAVADQPAWPRTNPPQCLYIDRTSVLPRWIRTRFRLTDSNLERSDICMIELSAVQQIESARLYIGEMHGESCE